jgi:hypothetical protein
MRCIKSQKSADLHHSHFSWSPAELHWADRQYLQADQLISFSDISNSDIHSEIFSEIHSVDSLPINISGKYCTSMRVHTIVLWYGVRCMDLYLLNTFHSILRNLFYNSFNLLHFTSRNVTSIINTQRLCCGMWTIYKFIYLEKLLLCTQDQFLNNFNIFVPTFINNFTFDVTHQKH